VSGIKLVLQYNFSCVQRRRKNNLTHKIMLQVVVNQWDLDRLCDLHVIMSAVAGIEVAPRN
jgi:hypothetical protein